jgi:Polyketide cyclase / dehydrase and lipid transport
MGWRHGDLVALFGMTLPAIAASDQTNQLKLSAQPTGNLAMTMKDDLANRSREIHWPQGFEPEKADLFAHNQLLINASCERVWKHIVEATRWPEWYPNSRDVRFVSGDQALTERSVFRWTTFSFPLESRVNEFTPHNRIGWYGYAVGAAPTFYHTWYLAPQEENACLVVTDEIGKGQDALHLRQTD